MAVQAQYPSNILLLNRNDQERKNQQMEYTLQTQTPPAAFLDQQSSSPFFPIGGSSSINTRKRGRDSNPTAASAAQQQYSPINLFSLQPHHHHHHQQQQQQISSAIASSPIHISQLHAQWQQKQQHQQPNSLVSTGLRLSFSENQQTQQNKHQQFDFSAQIDLQKDEIDRLLHAQMEQLRRTLADTRRKHYRALVSAAEESATRRMQEKSLELEMAARRNAELEESVARLKAESVALQAKARADEAAAMALQTQLRHAAAERAAAVEDPAVSDCESACVDPRRERDREARVCRRCWSAAASVVLLPCRHLCICRSCDARAAACGDVCPVCSCVRSASVEVYLS